MTTGSKYSGVAGRRQDRTPQLRSPDEFAQQLDEFGFGNFVELVSNQLADPRGDQATGLVVGVTGPWGSGKTFVLNWVCAEVARRLGDDGLLIRFDPWRVSGRGDVLLAFLRQLSQAIEAADGDLKATLKDKVEKYLPPFVTRNLAKGKETAQSLLDLYEKGSGKVLQVLMSQTVDQTYAKLAEQLAKIDVPIVAVIDDLDRLDDSEIRDIAQLVKAVGQFDNVSYLLAYDPRRVARALTGSGDIDEGLQYLEKIVQLQLRLPRVPRSRLRAFAIRLLAFSDFEPEHDVKAGEVARIIDDLVPEILWTPRDLVRFSNLARARMQKRDGLDIPDLLRFAALEVRFPLLSDRLGTLLPRCTIDGVREQQRCQQPTLPNGEDVIDFLLHGETLQHADRRFPGSRALLKLLFPALRPEGTEQVARPIERLCYESSLKTALNHQQPEHLLTVPEADAALRDPTALLNDVLTTAAEHDLSRHAHLRLRTQYSRLQTLPDADAIWRVVAEHFDTRLGPEIRNWSMFLDLSHVWVRGALSRFLDASTVITAATVRQWIADGRIHLPACLLFFECSGHELYGLEQRASLRPLLDKSDVRSLMTDAARSFTAQITASDPPPVLKGIYPLWVVSRDESTFAKVSRHLSNPATTTATDDIVCLLFRTWHETIGGFTLKTFIEPRALLHSMRIHATDEARLSLPLATAYRFVQDNLFAT